MTVRTDAKRAAALPVASDPPKLDRAFGEIRAAEGPGGLDPGDRLPGASTGMTVNVGKTESSLLPVPGSSPGITRQSMT